jgi:nucleotide-binding universal stress UspA family protein
MSRRIVVGLDGSDYAANAVRIGCESARRLKGTLVGVAVVDSPGIDASACGAGLGASDYAKRVREFKLEDADHRVRGFLDDFERKCSSAGVRFELAYRDAVPFQAIVDEARCADLIIVGLRTHFHFETMEGPGDTLRRLMECAVCPVVAVPKDADLPKRAIIAYDGSIQAARALRAYVQFAGYDAPTRNVTLLHVGEGTDEDQQVQLEQARRYVEGYGFQTKSMTRTGKPAQVIEEVAEEHRPCVVVLGAYGRRGIIKDLFFGSTAENLIAHERFPMFVYH